MKYRASRTVVVSEVFEFEAPNWEIAKGIVDEINNDGDEPNDFELIRSNEIDNTRFHFIGES